jgi:putative ABC transport system permease protein
MYFETMGIRLLAGRTFEEMRHDRVHEALIDRQMARYFFGERSPLGATLMCDDRALTIIGVVEQPRIETLHRDDGRPQIFIRAEDYTSRPERFAVLTDGDPRLLMSQVQPLIRGIDRRVPVSDVRTMEDIVAETRSHERISAVMIAGLAAGALLLVAMGLFGVISGSVARRRGELAVRMALGATHGRILRLVVAEGLRLIVVGLLCGVPGIYLTGQALQGFLIGVSPFDILTLSSMAVILVLITLLACYLGARRVIAIAPERLLREVE